MQQRALQSAQVFLRSWLAYQSHHADIPGFSVAISSQNTLMFHQAYGLADVAHMSPLTTQHLFAIGSQSKMYTATAIAQLAENGSLSLDDPIIRYLPWLAAHPNPWMTQIRLRHLLGHTSGLSRESKKADYWQLAEPFPSVAKLHQLALRTPIVQQPGRQLKYSNFGYALLGQVVEVVSGQRFGQYLEHHLFRPLGTRLTVAHLPPADQRARGYAPRFHHQRQALVHQPTHSFTTVTGLWSTPAELCQFAAAHFHDSRLLLGTARKKELHTRYASIKNGYSTGYEIGLGFERRQLHGRWLLGHTGHYAGHNTATFFDPQAKLAVSVAANCKDAYSEKIVLGIFEILDFFAAHDTQMVPPQIARYGIFAANPFAAVAIVATSQKIIVVDPNEWTPFRWVETLQPLDATTLKVTTQGSLFNQGELICYKIERTKVRSITFAGLTMKPVTYSK